MLGERKQSMLHVHKLQCRSVMFPQIKTLDLAPLEPFSTRGSKFRRQAMGRPSHADRTEKGKEQCGTGIEKKELK